jgi:site-specific recombinase XerC
MLLAATGRIPTFDAAIFADTGWEPIAVYRHLHRLTRIADAAGIPVVRVRRGHIRRDALDPAHRFASMPLYSLGLGGERGMARRQCTSVLRTRNRRVSYVSSAVGVAGLGAVETAALLMSIGRVVAAGGHYIDYLLSMLAQRILMPSSGAVSWTVVGEDLLPVAPVEAFLAYLAAVERSPLTVRTYAHDLAVYFRFLVDQGVDWREASLDLLSGYIFWLRRPAPNVVVLDVEESRRSPRTVNRMLGAVASFYDYQARCGVGVAVAAQLTVWRRIARRDYRPMLHHIAKSRPVATSALRLRTNRRLPKTLTAEQVQRLLDACTHLRDRFLIALLYETGMRIGQALGLRHEDMRTCESPSSRP